MLEKQISLTDIRQDYEGEEEMGYDAPFTTFTWERWQQMQARMFQCFTRFQRAIDSCQPRLAFLIVMEMQEITFEMQKEACEWIGVTKE
jgi:hypothetical protein